MKNLQLLMVSLALVSSPFSYTCNAQFAEDYVNTAGIINDHKLVMDIMERKYPGYGQQVLETFDRNNYVDMSKNAKRYTSSGQRGISCGVSDG